MRVRSRPFGRLRDDASGLAMVEFAFIMPIFLLMALTGAELTSYVVTRMRLSQLALHLADNAARIGTGSLLQEKRISEADIEDLLIGTGLQAGELDLYNKGRVILSSLEPMANPNTSGRYRIAWQRCRGARTAYGSSYGVAGQASGTNMTGMGPVGRRITVPDGVAAMYVEIHYDYTPIFKMPTGLANVLPTKMTEPAAMLVRDRRDLSQIYPVTGVTPSTC